MADDKKPKKGGAMLPIGGGVVGGALAALGVSYADPFGTSDAVPVNADLAAMHSGAGAPPDHVSGKSGHGDPGTDEIKTKHAVYELEPIIVSLASPASRRPSRLRIVVGIEGGAAIEDAAKAEAARLRDAMTSATRGLSADELAAPEGLSLLREALLVSARGILGEEAVSGLLITDYVMN